MERVAHHQNLVRRNSARRGITNGSVLESVENLAADDEQSKWHELVGWQVVVVRGVLLIFASLCIRQCS